MNYHSDYKIPIDLGVSEQYICFEPEGPCHSENLLELYQQMDSRIFLKWYYENQLIISTTKEKLIRYKNGKLCFYLPLEV